MTRREFEELKPGDIVWLNSPEPFTVVYKIAGTDTVAIVAHGKPPEKTNFSCVYLQPAGVDCHEHDKPSEKPKETATADANLLIQLRKCWVRNRPGSAWLPRWRIVGTNYTVCDCDHQHMPSAPDSYGRFSWWWWAQLRDSDPNIQSPLDITMDDVVEKFGCPVRIVKEKP